MSAPAMDDGWPTVDPGLERRYRRLLRAYPRTYRRRHGTEMVTTMLDLSAPEQRRPTPAQVLNLVVCGIRQRFRLPAGRPLTVLAAVLVSVALAALGAGAGSWLGWQTAPAVTDAEVRRLAELAVAQPHRGEVTRHADSAYFTEVVTTHVELTTGWSPEDARSRLVRDGWEVGPITEEYPEQSTGDARDTVARWRHAAFTATRSGLEVEVAGSARVDSSPVGGRPFALVGVDAWATEPAVATPFAVLGWLLGAVLGWLLTAAVAYRLAGGPPTGRTVGEALAGISLAALAVPTVAIHRQLLRVLEAPAAGDLPYAVHSAFRSTEHLSPGVTPSLTVAGLLTGIAAVALAARTADGGHRRTAQPSAVRLD